MPTARHRDASFRRPMPTALGFTCSSMKRTPDAGPGAEPGHLEPHAVAAAGEAAPSRPASESGEVGVDGEPPGPGRDPAYRFVVV